MVVVPVYRITNQYVDVQATTITVALPLIPVYDSSYCFGPLFEISEQKLSSLLWPNCDIAQLDVIIVVDSHHYR
jgi:hypothetical protein